MIASGPEDLVARVRRLATSRLRNAAPCVVGVRDVMRMLFGKMLRTRLAGHLAGGVDAGPGASSLEAACAATELVHTASLCHDDLIDGGLVRRARPTLWRSAGPVCAILIGDFLIFEAIGLVLDAGDGQYAARFTAALREMCAAEAEQALELKGRSLDVRTCLRIARGKTGALFGFVARVCGGDEPLLSEALEEAGYLVGTAYQLADDLLDVVGDEHAAGKTLRLDSAQMKCTLAQLSQDAGRITRDHIRSLLGSALGHLEEWPAARDALAQFLRRELLPLFEKQIRLAGLRSVIGEERQTPVTVPAGAQNAPFGRS